MYQLSSTEYPGLAKILNIALPGFPASQYTQASPLYFLLYSCNQPFLSNTIPSLLWEKSISNHVRSVFVLAAEMLVFIDSLRWQSREICIDPSTCIHISIDIYRSSHLCLCKGKNQFILMSPTLLPLYYSLLQFVYL